MFTKGMEVKVLTHGAGITSEEIYEVLDVDKNGTIYLDCGKFIDGKMDGVFGFWLEIKPINDELDKELKKNGIVSYYDEINDEEESEDEE